MKKMPPLSPPMEYARLNGNGQGLRNFVRTEGGNTEAHSQNPPFARPYRMGTFGRGRLGRAWQLRIGIHTGPVTAGVIGDKKFAYDIWGDTVNTTSRMESSGEAGEINISGSTYQLLQSFSKFQTLEKLQFTFSGKIQAKNKEEIEMYFVESRNNAG